MDISNIRIIIGRNIRHQRQLSGLQEAVLASHLGIPLKRLRKYESGGDSPTCDELIALARLFRCPVDMLCRETP